MKQDGRNRKPQAPASSIDAYEEAVIVVMPGQPDEVEKEYPGDYLRDAKPIVVARW